MKNKNNPFSYRPYRLFGKEESPIQIVRVAPDRNSVRLEWLGEKKNYTLFFYKGEKTIKKIEITGTSALAEGFKENEEYSVNVSDGENTSEKRFFVTGDYRGEVINYLHPNDLKYDFSGRFLATPSIARFQENLYVVMDVFRGGNQTGAFNLSLLFRSEDNGKNWNYVCDLLPCFWPTLFTADGKLCILACETELGSLVVSSSGNGVDWETPTVLIYGGGYGNPGPHKSATPPLEYDGKLYFGVEYGGYGVKRFDSLVVSLELGKDVMNIDSWTVSDKRRVEFEWGGDLNIRFAIEGNIAERNGELFDILRFTAGKALMLHYDKNYPEKAPEFYKVIDFPLGHCKFYIVKGEDGIYYAMGNETCYPRHIVALYRSRDLENWEKVKTLADISALSAADDGIQYPAFVMEGEKMYTVLRTGLNGADSFHNTNAVTFGIFDTDEEQKSEKKNCLRSKADEK